MKFNWIGDFEVVYICLTPKIRVLYKQRKVSSCIIWLSTIDWLDFYNMKVYKEHLVKCLVYKYFEVKDNYIKTQYSPKKEKIKLPHTQHIYHHDQNKNVH